MRLLPLLLLFACGSGKLMRTFQLALLASIVACGGKDSSTTSTPTGTTQPGTGTGTGAATGTGTGAATGTGTGTGTGTATGTGTGTGAATGTGTGTGSTTTGPDALIAAGWSFGECMSQCKGDLTVAESAASFTLSNWDGTIYTVNNGTLTATGLSQSRSIASTLVGVTIVPVYGCPDCADGGAAYVELRRTGAVTHHDYPVGGPQTDLVAADTFATDVMSALRTCIASPLVTPGPGCTPY